MLMIFSRDLHLDDFDTIAVHTMKTKSKTRLNRDVIAGHATRMGYIGPLRRV